LTLSKNKDPVKEFFCGSPATMESGKSQGDVKFKKIKSDVFCAVWFSFFLSFFLSLYFVSWNAQRSAS
jgi:hypothetical protein